VFIDAMDWPFYLIVLMVCVALKMTTGIWLIIVLYDFDIKLIGVSFQLCTIKEAGESNPSCEPDFTLEFWEIIS
jgi:hypothetical protein